MTRRWNIWNIPLPSESADFSTVNCRLSWASTIQLRKNISSDSYCYVGHSWGFLWVNSPWDSSFYRNTFLDSNIWTGYPFRCLNAFQIPLFRFIFQIFIFLRWRLPNGLNFDRPFPQCFFGLTKSADFSVWTLSIKRSFLDS